MKSGNFHSNGKLLITGEYTVLYGASALALPVRFGQSLNVSVNEERLIHWKSKDTEGVWFEAIFSLPSFNIHYTSDQLIAQKLAGILKAGRKLSHVDPFHSAGFTIETSADFNRHWGLGTSSTLIVNIARWLEVSPWDLFWETFGGSGYDIACAMANGPIIYRLKDKQPEVSPVEFNPPFRSSIHFVYTGKKMDTFKSVAAFREYAKVDEKVVSHISNITQNILKSSTIEEFDEWVKEHESFMSDLLKKPTVQEDVFPDFSGCIKSLGAWGGDFLMATMDDAEYLQQYFKGKGLTTIFPAKEIVL